MSTIKNNSSSLRLNNNRGTNPISKNKPSTPAPPGKVWSEEHGHYHDAPSSQNLSPKIVNTQNKNNTSIHLEKFTKIPSNWQNKSLNDKWITLKKIRDNCNISIEEKRANKIIGSSLEAKIDLKLGKKLFKIAKDTDFAELCITSVANVSESENDNEDILVNTLKAEGNKCPICWKINKDKCERHVFHIYPC